MNDEVIVSINCLVYNHEKYLRQCLDGLLAQKTNFKYEILIHDDASTDSSPDIIREYEQKYPEIIKPIYQKENQYSKRINVTKIYQEPRMIGKYVASCEGDDFWCDEYKLQKQVDIMEKNPDCHLCLHKVQAVKEDGTPLDRYYPDFAIKEGMKDEFEFMQYVFYGYSFQTTSYFRRIEDYREFFNSPPEFFKVSDVGDEPTLLYFGTKGKTYYINEVMSCYRLNSVGSWSVKQKNNPELQKRHIQKMKEMYLLFNEYSNYKYTDQINEKVSVFDLSMILLSTNSLLKKITFFFKKSNIDSYKDLTGRAKIKLLLSLYLPFLLKIYSKIRSSK